VCVRGLWMLSLWSVVAVSKPIRIVLPEKLRTSPCAETIRRTVKAVLVEQATPSGKRPRAYVGLPLVFPILMGKAGLGKEIEILEEAFEVIIEHNPRRSFAVELVQGAMQISAAQPSALACVLTPDCLPSQKLPLLVPSNSEGAPDVLLTRMWEGNPFFSKEEFRTWMGDHVAVMAESLARSDLAAFKKAARPGPLYQRYIGSSLEAAFEKLYVTSRVEFTRNEFRRGLGDATASEVIAERIFADLNSDSEINLELQHLRVRPSTLYQTVLLMHERMQGSIHPSPFSFRPDAYAQGGVGRGVHEGRLKFIGTAMRRAGGINQFFQIPEDAELEPEEDENPRDTLRVIPMVMHSESLSKTDVRFLPDGSSAVIVLGKDRSPFTQLVAGVKASYWDQLLDLSNSVAARMALFDPSFQWATYNLALHLWAKSEGDYTQRMWAAAHSDEGISAEVLLRHARFVLQGQRDALQWAYLMEQERSRAELESEDFSTTLQALARKLSERPEERHGKEVIALAMGIAIRAEHLKEEAQRLLGLRLLDAQLLGDSDRVVAIQTRINALGALEIRQEIWKHWPCDERLPPIPESELLAILAAGL
jgi:hypothetical protein